jgi:succinyldiaminopimelate transaminase
MTNSFVNEFTSTLAPYPMEELARIKKEVQARGQRVFDFGTGDPTIPTWRPIMEALKNNIAEISQYPSIIGGDELRAAHYNYLKRRVGLEQSPDWTVIPTRGSKEAIFHIAQSLVGRSGGKRKILYPDPGYPVYRSSAIFAGGIPMPVRLVPKNGFLFEPWNLHKSVTAGAAAIWVNYPHNPTGACAPKAYWEKLIDWCHQTDTVLLSDDCYLDIYSPKLDAEPGIAHLPTCPLGISTDRVLTFMSLSKRSGMTGYRAGLIAGDVRILAPHIRARANFGLGMPEFIQKAATCAWNDENHVRDRRKIFSERLDAASAPLIAMGLLSEKPEATFYLWCKIPSSYGDEDVDFCLSLAKKGVLCSPSSWLSEGITGWFRLALVPEISDILEAIEIIKHFVR